MKNYYEIFEISPNATDEQIKKQYRFLLHAYHPDKFPELDQKKKAEEKAVLINEAYSVLANPQKRHEYDIKIGINRPIDNSSQTYNNNPMGYGKSDYEKAYSEKVRREYYEQQRIKTEKERTEAEQIRKRKLDEDRKKAEAEKQKREKEKQDPIETERLNREAKEKQQEREKEYRMLTQGIIGFFILVFLIIPIVLIFSSISTPTSEQSMTSATDIYQPVIHPTITITPTPLSNATRVREIDGMMMVNVPEGEFIMGSIIRSNEQPIHSVNLDSYWIDQTEVTNAQYGLCVDAGVCNYPTDNGSRLNISYFENPEFLNYPVIYVTWFDAQEYCEWIGGGLPTEAQWEKAARGIEGNIYPWGDGFPTSSLANYGVNIGDTAQVGTYINVTGPYGALDMTGNVAEWVADWYSADYYLESPQENPTGIETGEYRVVRGGSWSDRVVDLRPSERNWRVPESSYNDVGFRCVIPD